MSPCPRSSTATAPTLTPVMEDYLEAILALETVQKVARVKDLAARLGVSKPSVTQMLKSLRDRNLIHYERYGLIDLSDEGRSIAEGVRRRHELIAGFLTEVLAVPTETAGMDACRMEHGLSDETLNALVLFMEFIRKCPLAGHDWLNHFRDFKNRGNNPSLCRHRLSETLKRLEQHLEETRCPLSRG